MNGAAASSEPTRISPHERHRLRPAGQCGGDGWGSRAFLFKKRAERFGGLQRPVSAERGVHPARREEDVAGLLDLAQQLERRAGRTGARAPRAAGDSDSAAIRAPTARAAGSRRRGSAANACSRDAGIGRERRHHEREPRLAIGVLRAIAAAARRICSQPGTSRTASSSAIAISSGSASVRPGIVSSRRHTRSSQATPSGVSTMSRKALNHAAFWLCVAARRARRAASPRAPAPRARALGGGRNRQKARVDVAQARAARSARRSRAAARAARRRGTRRRRRARSSRLSHSVTHALPRVSGSGTSSMCVEQIVAAAVVQHETAVAEPAAVRQHVERRAAARAHPRTSTVVAALTSSGTSTPQPR